VPALADQILQNRSFVLAQTNDVLLDRSFRRVLIPATVDEVARESENQLRIHDGRHQETDVIEPIVALRWRRLASPPAASFRSSESYRKLKFSPIPGP
jgi:hypothetical protein